MYSNELVLAVLNYIDSFLNENIKIDVIAERLYINKFYLMKRFKKETNLTIVNYINKKRIYNSLFYLKNNNYKVLSIAIRNGFNSVEYFSETFKSIIGVSPADYKRFLRKNLSLKRTNLIIENIALLQSEMDFINNYKNNRKPVGNPAKKLSIFKSYS